MTFQEILKIKPGCKLRAFETYFPLEIFDIVTVIGKNNSMILSDNNTMIYCELLEERNGFKKAFIPTSVLEIIS